VEMALKEPDEALSLDDEYHIDSEIRKTVRIIYDKNYNNDEKIALRFISTPIYNFLAFQLLKLILST
jgi:hypothetical protein